MDLIVEVNKYFDKFFFLYSSENKMNKVLKI